MKKTVFGHELTLKEETCSLNGAPGRIITEPYVNMYVTMTNTCNARCRFCCNEKNSTHTYPFDFYKFYYIIRELRKQIIINKLSFTGGEPSRDMELLTKSVRYVKEIDKDIFTIINTNGSALAELDKISRYFDSIALSRHYFTDKVNDEIFRTAVVARSQDIESFKAKNILHLSCNLQKGYIDSPRKIMLYLEEAAKLGVDDVGFVSLMPANDYCREKFVDFADVDFTAIENMYISKDWQQKSYCRCRNYLYMPKSDESKVDYVKLYTRYYVDPTYSLSTLVYDGMYLREGFNGQIIL